MCSLVGRKKQDHYLHRIISSAINFVTPSHHAYLGLCYMIQTMWPTAPIIVTLGLQTDDKNLSTQKRATLAITLLYLSALIKGGRDLISYNCHIISAQTTLIVIGLAPWISTKLRKLQTTRSVLVQGDRLWRLLSHLWQSPCESLKWWSVPKCSSVMTRKWVIIHYRWPIYRNSY